MGVPADLNYAGASVAASSCDNKRKKRKRKRAREIPASAASSSLPIIRFIKPDAPPTLVHTDIASFRSTVQSLTGHHNIVHTTTHDDVEVYSPLETPSFQLLDIDDLFLMHPPSCPPHEWPSDCQDMLIMPSTPHIEPVLFRPPPHAPPPSPPLHSLRSQEQYLQIAQSFLLCHHLILQIRSAMYLHHCNHHNPTKSPVKRSSEQLSQ
ncbi:hypothetical protein GOP47_0012158 [Adiantum capillus-veneris]|uniref:VQ domain-containing protein n=1 Tax=Adiantum capillus-veneris TaxID=13818 RepID=A0A9D4ZFE8_ADICA|nr:hypothetical protein GOP47_0012158 [Adiantum capillus-veneris]